MSTQLNFDAGDVAAGTTNCRYDDANLILVAEVQIWTTDQGADLDRLLNTPSTTTVAWEWATGDAEQFFARRGGTVVGIKATSSLSIAEQLAAQALDATA